MADDDARPMFGELLKQSQSALAGLQALEEHLSSRLADQHAQLQATRVELEESRSEIGTLQGAHERLTAEHARAIDDAAHHRQARNGLEATVADLRRELEAALRQREELAAAGNRERRELEGRLAALEASLAGRAGRVGALEAKLDDLTAAQVAWQAEREALVGARDQLTGRITDLEAGQRQAADDLARAIHNREQLRTVFEDLKRSHATLTERSAASFQEMSRLQEEAHGAAAQTAAQARTTTQLSEELARARAAADQLQTDQLTWAADREALLEAARLAEDRMAGLAAELARTKLALGERTATAETETTALRQQAAALQLQLSEERERLEASLAVARDQARNALESTALAEKTRAEAQAQYASLVERAQVAAQEWSARRQALADDNQRLMGELAEARDAFRAAGEASRELQRQMHQLEETHREEMTAMEDSLRAARDAATNPLTPQQGHRINTRLNAIVGFSSILLDPRANAIAVGEEADYLQLISENSRALAQELNLISVAGAAVAGPAPAAAGLPVASLGDSPQRPTVLVADADPAVRERLLSFLTRAGYEVVFAATKDEVIANAASLSPLLILIDATLPPSGAAAVVAELKRDPRTTEIPLVVATANMAEPLRLDYGQVDVLSKPIDRHQLLQLMINHDLQADAKRARKLPATVLLIDDDPLSTRLLKAVLRPLHIEVITAESGKAGIELAKKARPETIICDLLMPDIDGFEVIAALSADEHASKIPILVYTGKSITAEDQQRLQGLVPSIIRKGEFNRERFIELLLKRGERRVRGAKPPLAA